MSRVQALKKHPYAPLMLSGLLCLVLALLVVYPWTQSGKALQRKTEQMRVSVRKQEKLVKEYRQDQGTVRKMREYFGQVSREQLDGQSDQLVELISQKFNDLDVELKRIKILPKQDLGVAYLVRIGLSVEGDWQNIARLIFLLDSTEEPLRLRDLSLEGRLDSKDHLSAEMVISRIYIQ